MRLLRLPVVCDRVRAQISLELDGELSQFERAMLAAHLARCPDCRAYEAEVTAFTRALRAAPLERVETRVVVRRPRRVAAVRLPASVAAVLALAVVGVASQLAANQAADTRLSSPRAQLRFPTLDELEHELTLIEAASGSRRGARETVR